MASAIVRRMNASTKNYTKNTLLYSALFAPTLAVALWAGTLSGQQCFLAILAAIGLALGAFCFLRRKDDLVHDFFLPILLFAALGGMSWAVRGSAGYGSVKGCIFAGVLWGAAWWFIARNPSGPNARRYASGWVILALTLGIGFAGARGWAQWQTFFDGVLQTNTSLGEKVDIAPFHGYIWLFIAGVPWAGLGACLLAWCATEKPLAAWQWFMRLFCGFGAAFFASWLFDAYPQWFLPLYSTMKDQYADATANPNLKRLINDNGAAIQHLGFYLGFLLFEIGRRDWKNVVLITTVGLVNGVGWALLANWHWSKAIWPTMENYWRGWESTSGISIGIALGLAYYLVNRRTAPCACETSPARAGFPIFGALSMIFMSVILLWYVVGNYASLFSAEWARHAPFCAVLLYGLGLYFWHLRRKLLDTSASSDIAIPKLGTWGVHFGLMALVAWFMMGPVEFFRAPDAATPWWMRFDYLFVGATTLYGVLYFVTALWKTTTVRPGELASIAPFFQRHPSLDWLTVYLSLVVIACSFLRGEVPVWKGWLWMTQETPTPWIGMLGFACLAAFGLIWCALSYFQPREDDGGLERFTVHLGVLVGLGLSIKNGARGWARIEYGEADEHLWGDFYWQYIGPVMLALLGVIVAMALVRRVMAPREGDSVPHAWAFIVVVLLVQNALAHLVTRPLTDWNEAIFNLYYVLLFFLSATILYHYHFMQTWVPFLVAGIDADEDDIVETPEAAAPASALMGDAEVEPIEEAEALDDVQQSDEIVEESNDEAQAVDTVENEVVADEIEVSTVPSPEEAYDTTLTEEEAVPEYLEEQTAPEVVAEEHESPEVPAESLSMADDGDAADLEGTPMFDDDELPADKASEEEASGEDRIRPM